MAISVHDNILLGYTVRCQAREIVLQTEYPGREPRELTDVVFTGVVAYHFHGDNLETIIYDIDETPIAGVFDHYAALLTEMKPYAWPAWQYDTPADLAGDLSRRGVRAFVLHASLGMTGFVLAERMDVSQTSSLPQAPPHIVAVPPVR